MPRPIGKAANRSSAARIDGRELPAAQKDRLLLQPAAPLDPGLHGIRIGGGKQPRLVVRRICPPFRISPARRMEAEHGARRDTDPVARNGAQHQRAGREAGAVDHDTLARLAQQLEDPKVFPDLAPFARYDSHSGPSWRYEGQPESRENDEEHRNSPAYPIPGQCLYPPPGDGTVLYGCRPTGAEGAFVPPRPGARHHG